MLNVSPRMAVVQRASLPGLEQQISIVGIAVWQWGAETCTLDGQESKHGTENQSRDQHRLEDPPPRHGHRMVLRACPQIQSRSRVPVSSRGHRVQKYIPSQCSIEKKKEVCGLKAQMAFHHFS